MRNAGDHGLNASTFAARVIVSAESNVISAVTGAVGALKGRLHGGAPGPALDLVFEVGSAERAERCRMVTRNNLRPHPVSIGVDNTAPIRVPAISGDFGARKLRLVAQGAEAEVFEWRDGRVLKLLRARGAGPAPLEALTGLDRCPSAANRWTPDARRRTPRPTDPAPGGHVRRVPPAL